MRYTLRSSVERTALASLRGLGVSEDAAGAGSATMLPSAPAANSRIGTLPVQGDSTDTKSVAAFRATR